DVVPVLGERVRLAREVAESQRRRCRLLPGDETGAVRADAPREPECQADGCAKDHTARGSGGHRDGGHGARRDPAGHAVISRVVIVYLKLSGSRLSRRPCAVSDCGYMKNDFDNIGTPREDKSVRSISIGRLHDGFRYRSDGRRYALTRRTGSDSTRPISQHSSPRRRKASKTEPAPPAAPEKRT